ncbi:MAG: hypothetical protein P8Y16_06890, partial [Sulfurimonas sp.]
MPYSSIRFFLAIQIYIEVEDILELKQRINAKPNFSKELDETLTLIEKRAIGYKLVQNSLITAVTSKDTEDIRDALIGFDMISSKFSHDISILMEQVRDSLDKQIETLKTTNEQNSSTLIFSFVLSTLLIVMTMMKFYSSNLKISR